MSRKGRPFCSAWVTGCLWITGCSSSNDQGAVQVPVTVSFDLQVNGEPFTCGRTYAGVGSPPAPFTVTDARFYLHNPELVEASGRTAALALDRNAFQNDGLALLDFEDGCGPDGTPATHASLTGSVRAGSYERIRFTLGVPADRNFVNLAAASPPLDVTGMYWIWQFGYKFLKLDGASPAEDGGIDPFFVHLGASGCPGDTPEALPTGECMYPNRVDFDLGNFALETTKVVADVAELLASSDLSKNTDGTAPGCMSEATDPECVTILPRLGIGNPSSQQLFHVE